MNLNFNTKPFNSFINGDDHLVLEIAVAGFDESELQVSRIGEQLFVRGSKAEKRVEVKRQFNRGISYRDFKDMFIIPVGWKMLVAEFINGVLRIKFYEDEETLPITTIKVNQKSPEIEADTIK